MRKYYTIKQIKNWNRGVRAYILISAGGSAFILKATNKGPEGKFCLLGIIE